jgi:LysR family hydrogen peroxide-inducible transcriptional activator
MSLHLPTTRQLQYFLALEEHEHFGRAAEASNVSQSAFSVAIQELEAALNVQLVDRTSRQVTITSVGREIADQARLCLRDLGDLVEIARGRQGPLTGPLRLGIIPTIAPFVLPRLMPAIRKRFAGLRPFLTEDLTLNLHQQLMDGGLDLILIALPYELRNVETEVLFRDRFRLAARADTRLVDPGKFRLNRLNAESVLLLRDGHCLRDHAIDACRLRSADSINRFAATSLLTLIEMVDADLGVTFLPEMAEGSAMLKATKVRTWPLSDKNYREIALAWRRGSARADDFRALGDLITSLHQRSG